MSSPPQMSSPRDDLPSPAVPGAAAGAWREVLSPAMSPRVCSSNSPQPPIPSARGLSRDPPPPSGTGGLRAPTPPGEIPTKRGMSGPISDVIEMTEGTQIVTHSFHGYPLTNPIQVPLQPNFPPTPHPRALRFIQIASLERSNRVSRGSLHTGHTPTRRRL